MFDLGLSSPRTTGGGGGAPLYWLVDDEVGVPDPGVGEYQGGGHRHQGGSEQNTNADRHQGSGDEGQTPTGFGWSDAHRWRPPQLDEAVEPVPPRWLGVPTRRAVRPASPTARRVEPPLHTYRLGAVLPHGSVVAVVLRAASPDEVWSRAGWSGSAEDVEAVLMCAEALVPDWLDEPSVWGLVPGPLTPRAVAAGMVEAAGWTYVTAGVRAVLGCGVGGVSGVELGSG